MSDKIKKCQMCNKKKTLAEFHTHNVPICAGCVGKDDTGKCCSKCHERKPHEDYPVDSRAPKDPKGVGRGGTCKVCKNASRQKARDKKLPALAPALKTAMAELAETYGKDAVKSAARRLA